MSGMKKPSFSALIPARLLIAVVIFFNLQAAIIFILAPARYAPAFELNGIPGQTMVSAMGILFMMWNVPYAVALWHPVRNRVSLYEAVAMQTIGLTGETILYLTLPGDHPVLAATGLRFIVFDGLGLLALIAAAVLTRNRHHLAADRI